jgi:hypothetical protein
MRRILRHSALQGRLVLRVVVALSMTLAALAATSIPTQVVPVGHARAAGPGATHHHAVELRKPSWQTNGQTTHATATTVPHVKTMLSSSWCGSWTRGPMYCINFNRSDQRWLALVSTTSAAASICAITGIGCVVAATVAAVAARWVDNHGYCPSTRPILEVEYAPMPGGYLACSNG